MFAGPFIFQMPSSGLSPVDPHLSGSVVLATGQLSCSSSNFRNVIHISFVVGVYHVGVCTHRPGFPWESMQMCAVSEARGAIHLTKCRRSFQHGMNHSSIDFTEQISIESKRSLEQLAHCRCLFYVCPRLTRWLPRLLSHGVGQED